MNGLSVSRREAPGRAVLELTGDVDIASCDVLQASLRELEHEGIRQVELDLSGVRYLDSTGVSLLVGHSSSRRLELRLRGASRGLHRLFRVLGLEGMLGEEIPSSRSA